MATTIELGRPRLVESDGVELDSRSSIAVASASTAGSVDVKYFVFEDKALKGEDYPALVKVWDNDVDAIYDTL